MQDQVGKLITNDYLRLSIAIDKMSQAFKNAEKIIENGDIQEVDAMIIKYQKYNQTLEDCRYLENISEDLIFESYQHAIGEVHNKEFRDFNKDHHEAYIRLSLRSLKL